MTRPFVTLVLMMIWVHAVPPAMAAVQGKEVVYHADGTPLEGYLAWNDAVEGQRPGILVVHEWWGLNDYARKRARMLADLGYTALAVDMYGEGRQASHPEEARAFASALREHMPVAEQRFRAALAVLRDHPTVDPDRTAAIGYCLGGGIVLAMARAGVDLDGVVSFHGTLASDVPARPGEVKADILVLNGGADPLVPEEQIAAFKKEMDAAGADYRIITYPGAKHSFTNPEADALGRRFDLPLAYDPEADRQSWQAMQDFFDVIFKPGHRP